MIVPRQPPAPSYPAGRYQPRLCVHPARPQCVRCLPVYGARPHSRGCTPHPRTVPLAPTRRRDQARSGHPTKSVDRTLLRNIANAFSWLDRIKAGKTYEQIATEDAIPTDRVRKAIRYAFLAPDIVRAIVQGRQPVGLTSRLPLASSASRRLGETTSARRNAVSLQAPTS